LSFSDIWLFPLIRLGDGNEVLVSQLVLAATFLIIGIFIDRRLESLLGRQLHKRQLNPDAIQTAQRRCSTACWSSCSSPRWGC
jgi:hypothetical protein